MAKLICMKHPKYNAKGAPDLSCRVCCGEFVKRIEEKQKELKDSRPLEINRSLL